MISGLLKKIFGSRNDRLIKQYSAGVHQINALEAGTQTWGLHKNPQCPVCAAEHAS